MPFLSFRFSDFFNFIFCLATKIYAVDFYNNVFHNSIFILENITNKALFEN